MALPFWQQLAMEQFGLPGMEMYKQENPNNQVFKVPDIKVGYQGPSDALKQRAAMQEAGLLGNGNVFNSMDSLNAFRSNVDPSKQFNFDARTPGEGNISDWVNKNIVGQSIDPGSMVPRNGLNEYNKQYGTSFKTDEEALKNWQGNSANPSYVPPAPRGGGENYDNPSSSGGGFVKSNWSYDSEQQRWIKQNEDGTFQTSDYNPLTEENDVAATSFVSSSPQKQHPVVTHEYNPALYELGVDPTKSTKSDNFGEHPVFKFSDMPTTQLLNTQTKDVAVRNKTDDEMAFSALKGLIVPPTMMAGLTGLSASLAGTLGGAGLTGAALTGALAPKLSNYGGRAFNAIQNVFKPSGPTSLAKPAEEVVKKSESQLKGFLNPNISTKAAPSNVKVTRAEDIIKQNAIDKVKNPMADRFNNATFDKIINQQNPSLMNINTPNILNSEPLMLGAGKGMPVINQTPISPTFYANSTGATTIGKPAAMQLENAINFLQSSGNPQVTTTLNQLKMAYGNNWANRPEAREVIQNLFKQSGIYGAGF